MSNKHERELAGKVALVTGGSRGIDAALAKRLAADGASVAVTYSKGAFRLTVMDMWTVAALGAFVAGPESTYINGANLTVDGGTNA